MKPTRKRLVGVAAALSTVAMTAPVSPATAATAAPAITPVPTMAAVWDVSPAVAPPITGPGLGQAAVLIGPTIITTAPTSFINTNNQISADGNWSGGQLGP